MGHLAWLGAGVGVGVLTVSGLAAAQSAPTGTFPPTQPAAASGNSASAPLPPPPPPTPTRAPAPAPAPQASAAGVPPPAVPPPGYAQPYAPYPPPGYGYYYPPPTQRVKERFADDAAASSSPFIDVLVASISWQNRVSQFLNVGVQAGVYAAGRIRLTANLLLPTAALTDDYSLSYPYAPTGPTGTSYYLPQPSKAAALFYGATVGIVAVSSPTFLMSPGVAFSRTDVSDYGSALGLSLPFEWVMGNGLRLGLEFDAGRAFGGTSRQRCVDNVTGGACNGVAERSQNRPAGTSILLQFQLGFGFNHPEPLAPSPPSPSPAPYGWPAPPALPTPVPAPDVAPTPAPG